MTQQRFKQFDGSAVNKVEHLDANERLNYLIINSEAKVYKFQNHHQVNIAFHYQHLGFFVQILAHYFSVDYGEVEAENFDLDCIV